jgi:crotonobetainyl-CoA:carnitine CoA-transferase CaiB-like acyl-CoA transferase
MKNPAAREVLNPLIDWADVVVENFSPGTMAKLGLDYASLARRNPGIVMVSGSVYGQTGPLAQEWGVDGTGGALGGRTYLTGWADRPPVIPGAVPYGDVIVPYAMAAAAAAALERRRSTGRGAHIDASMYEICVQQMRDAIAHAAAGGRPQRTGNAEAGVLLQDVFPCAGEDRWIAISLFDAGDARRFAEATGVPAQGAAIAAWTAGQEDHALAERLQAAGIAAAVVQDVEDLIERDPQIAHRGTLVPIEHALLGRFGHLKTPMAFSRTPFAPYRAPSIGEHGRTIAGAIAGLDEDRIATLDAAGVFK